MASDLRSLCEQLVEAAAILYFHDTPAQTVRSS
jgi:hypothetical protein